MIRARFAPSPTGNLHIGSVRTALFNWLFSRHTKGTYVLRIEDTDQQRSEKKFEQNINDGLAWLGLTEDEGPEKGGAYGPYSQFERIQKGMYQDYAKKLVDQDLAYYCFCSDEELDQERREAKDKDIPYVYSQKCMALDKTDIAKRIESKEPYALRFKMPGHVQLSFKDLIRGEINFDMGLFSDFVIMKSDNTPSYNFAVVIDDMLMQITHVIRGEDHISNTPKQICLYQAFGASIPEFAHLPMILGPDRSKLSKRHGATSVTEYQEKGFLPEALLNYLVLLGWSSPDGEEILSKERLIELFSLERISKSNAIFDVTKLTWMNGQYIRNLDKKALYERVKSYISSEFDQALSKYSPDELEHIVFSVRDNLDVLSDINRYLDVFIIDTNAYSSSVRDYSFTKQDLDIINLFKKRLTELHDPLTQEQAEVIINSVVETSGLGRGKVYKPVRIACSGRPSGPSLYDIISILGKEEIGKRLDYMLDMTKPNR
ncbi:glutamate--tRNA ligase [Thermoproteota archaeon]